MQSLLLFLLIGGFHLSESFKFPAMDAPGISSRILTGSEKESPKAPAPAPQVTSLSEWRMEIEPDSDLSGGLEERVPVRIRVTNLGEIYEEFHIKVDEKVGNDQLFFVESLSKPILKIQPSESDVLTLTISPPSRARVGLRRNIRVRIFTDGDFREARNNYAVLTFSFLVSYSVRDEQKPEITLLSYPVNEQCREAEDNCESEEWKAIFLICDQGSGIRSITPSPLPGPKDRSRKYHHNFFTAGDPSEKVTFTYIGTCCDRKVKLRVLDGAGNEETVANYDESDNGEGGGLPPPSQSTGLSGSEIAIIVVVILLILVIIAAITAVVIIRQRRAANLAEMRRFPSAPVKL